VPEMHAGHFYPNQRKAQLMARYPLNTIVNYRSCGECQACCTVTGVWEMHKPDYTRCPNQCDSGCAIYENRPNTCRNFSCLWQSGLLPGDERRRPDKMGVVFEVREDDQGKRIQAWEVWPGAFNEPNVAFLINRLAEKIPLLMRFYQQMGHATIDRQQERERAWARPVK
jgi:hypothetical protein